ncbi:MAG TPA: HD domain-containing phosphohydrolase [Planctomycetota bacterium]|nr:HD domain-containing phosphohydrolase [Planctomycetota bacterium]
MSGTTTSRILESVDARTRTLVERLQHLQEIGTQLSAERDLVKLLSLILRAGREITQADAGAVFVREDDVQVVQGATGKDPIHRVTPYIALKVAQNDSRQFPFKEMKLPFEGKTISGHVALTGEILNLEDVYRLPSTVPFSYSTAFDEASGYRCKSMLVMPMRNREGETIGVLQLINKKQAPAACLSSKEAVERHVVPFDPLDEELVGALASQAAVCIEKAKLYDDIEGMFEGLVNSFTLALERRNRTTFGHCMRVARYAVAIAEAVNDSPPDLFGGLRFSPVQIRELRYAALLHDIGKIAVPEAVLDKQNKLLDSEIRAIEYRFAYAGVTGKDPALMKAWIEAVRRINIPRGLSPDDKALLEKIRAERFRDLDGQERPLLSDYEIENLAIERGNLTTLERRQIEQHIVDTWEILKRIPWPRDYRWVANLAACHHEKINGSGYPWKLKGDEIPVGGQILAIVDIFEALTAKDRPYKPAIPVDKAIAIVQAEVDRGALNAKLWKLFLDRRLYDLFRDNTGFVHRPADPVVSA